MAPLVFEGTPEAAQEQVREALRGEPRTELVAEHPGYIRAEVTSRLMRFVDDVEVAIDPATQRVQFRSASRIGYSDLGANRARMERFSERFQGLNSKP
jgi:uncharacterized protein (DUF1499 family)